MAALILKDSDREAKGLIHYDGECVTCGKRFTSANAVGLAALEAYNDGR